MTTPRVTVPVEPEFTHYRRSQIAHLRPYVAGETLSDRVSISAADLEAGSPKQGDMIARNPANHDDQWLVAADYFAANFEPVSAAPAPEGGAVSRDHIVAIVRQFASPSWCSVDRLVDTLFAALATREEAPDWTARTEAAWAENNREEAPADRAHPCYDEHQPGCDCVIPAQKATPVPSFLERMTALAEAGEIAQAENPGGFLIKDFADGWFWTPHRIAAVAALTDGHAVYDLRAQPPARDLAAEIDDVKKTLEADGQAIEYFEAQRRVAAFKALRGTEADKRAVSYIDAAILALQAREDAQPFAYLVDHKAAEHRQLIYHGSFVPASDHYKITKLYTHPAPDALRAAVEALEPFAKGGHHRTMPGLSPSYTVADFGDGVIVTVADFRRAAEALAALQAEQKGGA